MKLLHVDMSVYVSLSPGLVLFVVLLAVNRGSVSLTKPCDNVMCWEPVMTCQTCD